MAERPRLERRQHCRTNRCSPATVTRACARFREMSGLGVRRRRRSLYSARCRIGRRQTDFGSRVVGLPRKNLQPHLRARPFSLANADVIRPKKITARNIGRSYQFRRSLTQIHAHGSLLRLLPNCFDFSANFQPSFFHECAY
jgi:hypothetical protein